MSHTYKTRNRLLSYFGLMAIVVFGVISTLGSSSSGTNGGNRYEIRGEIEGLNLGNSVELYINSLLSDYENTITLTRSDIAEPNVRFSFGDVFENGVYAISVMEQPEGQTCSLTRGGTNFIDDFDVTRVLVTCTDDPPNTYTVTGMVTGLTSGLLALQNNGGDDLARIADGPFTFDTPVDDGQPYLVTVLTDPDNHTCSVTNGSGTSSTNISNVTVTCVSSAPGELDTSLNSVGYITHHNAAGGSGSDFGYGVAANSSNSIFVAGQSHIGSMVVWKYIENGTLDNNFGSGGIVIDNDAAGGTTAYGRAIAIDSSGNVYVTGAAVTGSPLFETRMALWKYDAFGIPDNTFGDMGVVISGTASDGYSLVIDTSGVTDKIVVAGEVDTGFGTDMAIWRYGSDGSPDNNFASDGLVTHDSAAGGNNDDRGHSVTIDGSDNIIVTGMSYNSSNDTDMVIWRYDSDGNLDTFFDDDGFYVNNGAAGGSSNDVGNAVKIDSQGRIVVTGSSFSAASSTTGEEMVIWRYNPATNSLDNTFDSDGDGIVIYVGDDDDGGHGIVFDSQNRILVTGVIPNLSNSGDMALWRYNENGVLDTSFGASNTGLVTHHNAASGDGWDAGADITLDTTGRIIVVGNSSGTNDFDMAIWRYNP